MNDFLLNLMRSIAPRFLQWLFRFQDVSKSSKGNGKKNRMFLRQKYGWSSRDETNLSNGNQCEYSSSPSADCLQGRMTVPLLFPPCCLYPQSSGCDCVVVQYLTVSHLYSGEAQISGGGIQSLHLITD